MMSMHLLIAAIVGDSSTQLAIETNHKIIIEIVELSFESYNAKVIDFLDQWLNYLKFSINLINFTFISTSFISIFIE